MPINLVYEKVWIPHIMTLRNLEEGSEIPKDIPPMKIVYRIAGFEGEATENRIDRLNEDDNQIQDPEKRYEIAKTLIEDQIINGKSNMNSLSILLKTMKDFNNNETILSIGKLLLPISQVNAIREKIIEKNGVGILLNNLLNRLGQTQTSENDQIIEVLIGVLGNIVVSTEKQGNSDRMQLENEEEEEESLSYLRLCFNKLDELNILQPKPEKTIIILTRILPFLAKDHVQTNVLLIERHLKDVAFSGNEPNGEMGKLLEIIEVLPKKFAVFRNLCFKYGILQMINEYFSSIIPNEKEINQEDLQLYQKNVTWALKMIKGIIVNNKNNQGFLYETNLLMKIYSLSNISIKIKEIGKSAEAIIEYLLQSDPNEIDSRVLDILKKISEEEKLQKKRLAELKRQEILKSMKAGNKFLSEEKNKKMETEEEKSISCIICHEGYNINPKNLLGVYMFSKLHKIPDENVFFSDLQCKEVNGIGSVTHFNCIHLKCHGAAAKAELSLKKPKKEWEGAIIRNSHTKCNNWFPIKGEGVPLNDYETGVTKYFLSIEPLIRNDQQSRSWIVLNDLKNLMLKFGKQESLSKESKGGSYEHNLKIIPFYMQMIIYLVNKEDSKKFSIYNECFLKIIEGKNKNLSQEQVYLSLTLSLFIMDANSFHQNKKGLLELFLKSSLDKKEEKSAKIIQELFCFENGENHKIFIENNELLIKLRPFLIYLCLVDEIFKKIHSKFEKMDEIWKLLEEEVSRNYNLLLKVFEEIANSYRNKITKINSLEEFCIVLEIFGKQNAKVKLNEMLNGYI